MRSKKAFLTDDVHESIFLLLKTRFPWLVIGLVGGIIASLLVKNYEVLIAQNLSLAFFLPVIVYMSDAVGSQTQTVYVRSLVRGKVDNFLIYLVKEFFVGIVLGGILGLLTGVFAFFWLNSFAIAQTVGIAMFVNIMISPILALIIVEILSKEKEDPALGSGPFTTVIQDILSLLIYFVIATLILFK